jgi:hypothetical protein
VGILGSTSVVSGLGFATNFAISWAIPM